MKTEETVIKISVRNLVEFILRSGDLDNRRGTGADTDAMQQGSRIHRKIQRSMGEGYRAEVPLRITVPSGGKEAFSVCIEGRADGIFEQDGIPVVDEIKSMYLDVNLLKEPIPMHRYQAMCYAYIYGGGVDAERVKIRLTYVSIETENTRYMEETFALEELTEWFEGLIREYVKWAGWQLDWSRLRNGSIKNLEFPFPYRTGQKELVSGVYKTLLRSRKLYIEAPTGVGKTMSTVFPAVKAMGEGLTGKLFYLTAKTITRTVAEEAFQILRTGGLKIKAVTITAKEKICILSKPDCNPAACERAKGHYDRVNDAVYDMLTHEEDINRELIFAYSEKYRVCPFEMCLDVTTWADVVICDYNYVFDPTAYLRRFFVDERKNDYVFLIDEAHNLVDRAREMYSAVLIKERFLTARKLVRGRSGKLEEGLGACNRDLLELKRNCDEFEVIEHIGDFALHLIRLTAEYEEFLREFSDFPGREEVLSLYFEIRSFMEIYEGMNEKYRIYTNYTESGEFRIKLQCMEPSEYLGRCLKRGRSAVFFSATLLPIRYYKEQLAGSDEDYAVYAPSPFSVERRLLLVGRDVSTRYTRRNQSEYDKIVDYIVSFTNARTGNYMVFFPSYQMMADISECMTGREGHAEIIVQRANMNEAEKEEFLLDFESEPEFTHIGFCVMGGIFGEGIDLKKDRLIGAVIVGTGLPMVCGERELFREYFEEKNHSGFLYAYLYSGMNKVLQSAGRVIRTAEDKGAILLLDERFQRKEYLSMFPREWFPHGVVSRRSMEGVLKDFWEREKE